MKELDVKGIAWAWLYDAQRWFRQMENKHPIDRMSKEELSAVLEAVWPVRDEIVAWERAYVEKVGAGNATVTPTA
jgi:hypothetical protein